MIAVNWLDDTFQRLAFVWNLVWAFVGNSRHWTSRAIDARKETTKLDRGGKIQTDLREKCLPPLKMFIYCCFKRISSNYCGLKVSLNHSQYNPRTKNKTMREVTRSFTTASIYDGSFVAVVVVVVVVVVVCDDDDHDDDFLCAQCFLKQTKLTTKQ